MTREGFRHICKACAMPVFFGIIVTVMVFLMVLRWVDEKRTVRFHERIATIESVQRTEQTRRNAEMAATRVLVLALVARPPQPEIVEVIRVDVEKASAPYGLSPVIADLLRELRARSEAKRGQATVTAKAGVR